MNTFSKTTQQTLKQIRSLLLKEHLELKCMLDELFSKAWNNNSIEPILEIINLNTSFVSQYKQLVINNDLVLSYRSKDEFSSKNEDIFGLNILEIHTKLAKLIPLYQKAIRSPYLSSFVRVLVSMNMAKLIRVKDNFLLLSDLSITNPKNIPAHS